MYTFGYHVKRALSGVGGKPFALVLTLGSVALAFVLLGCVFLIAQNLSQLTDDWGSGATVAVDLVDRVPPADAARIRQALNETPGVRRVRTVSPKEAKQRLMHHLGPDARFVADVEDSFLPLTYEVTLTGSRKTVLGAQQRLTRMAGVVPGVEAVRTVETWFHRLGQLVNGIRIAGFALGLLVLLACAYIIMVTIRLRFVDRRKELEVMRLMGATERFIKTPFLLEGVMHGLIGATVATGLLFGLYLLVIGRVDTLFGTSVSASKLGFLPPSQLGYGLAIGAVCGLIGALFATRTPADV
ncbi:MAG: permease-like cell division protein FtsX [bacterium]